MILVISVIILKVTDAYKEIYFHFRGEDYNPLKI